MNSTAAPVSAGLYLISTPIGNARDITLRALDLLSAADVIAAEDTRTARKLMDIHGIALGSRPLVAYHDHSGPKVRDRLLGAVGAGKSVVYASEAGTPLIADPGFALVNAARDRGLPVTAAPGPSALLAALAGAGLPTDRFAFLGFLPAGDTQRDAAIREIRHLPLTLVFYESPKRVGRMLNGLQHVLGSDRPAVVARELTKKFEELVHGTLGELADRYRDQPLRGEVVVIVGAAGAAEIGAGEVEDALREAMGRMRIKDAATAVAGAFGLPRRDVYQTALSLDVDAEKEGDE